MTIENAAKPLRIVNLLMDAYDLVFKAPPNIRGQVDHKLAVTLGKPTTSTSSTTVPCPPAPIIYNNKTLPLAKKDTSDNLLDATNTSTSSAPQFFCKQITKAAYEKEAKDNCRKAINDLLTTLLTDTSFSEKERKKRLKQFQKAYPEIYNERFNLHNVSTASSTVSDFTANFKHAAKPSFLREKIL